MLSQRITVEMYRLGQNDEAYQRLSEYFDQWNIAHRKLLKEDTGIGPGSNTHLKALNIIKGLSPNIMFIGRALERYSKEDKLPGMASIYHNQQLFLQGMEKAVKLLEESSSTKLSFIILIELILAAFSISIIFLELTYVRMPTFKELQRKIEALKFSERRLALITENFPRGAVTLLDKELKVVYTNGLGYKDTEIPPDLWKGRKIMEVLSEKNGKKLEEHLPLAMRDLGAEYRSSFVGREYLNILRPLKNDDGKLENLVMVTIDITEQMAIERELEKGAVRLERISWIHSHKIRGPLSSIMGLMTLLKEEKQEEERKKYLGFMEISCKQLDDAITKITNEGF